MKDSLRKLFKPLLKRFEPKADTDYVYQASHRKILLVVGCLFFVLAAISLIASFVIAQLAALFPVFIFGILGLICIVVGALGSDGAVANIWNRG